MGFGIYNWWNGALTTDNSFNHLILILLVVTIQMLQTMSVHAPKLDTMSCKTKFMQTHQIKTKTQRFSVLWIVLLVHIVKSASSLQKHRIPLKNVSTEFKISALQLSSWCHDYINIVLLLRHKIQHVCYNMLFIQNADPTVTWKELKHF